MMLFSTGTGLERVGVVWPDLACWRAGLQAPESSGLRLDRYNAELQAPNVYSSAKTRMMGGRRGLRPWPLRCLSQILPERKEIML